ncbi:insulinoma-associated protein 2 [Heteronotia binoei]|uniref:insulinoma-associated protein 2 n=1 Tax=Heteronotia binoei TaxID=13085 RepID=UPI0029311BC5|nr:insulinoma-associated protein 2 [Heteronotia binoei]
MPRGFLVKRSRRPGGSYRLRPPAALLEEAPLSPAPLAEPPHPHQPEALLTAVWEVGSSDCAAAAAAAAPDAEEPKPGARSPASAEPFPPSLAMVAEERLPPRTPVPLPVVPLALPAAAPLCPPGALKRPPRAKPPAAAKKPKAARKLSFADEVTTSPVLGLRIKAAPEGGCEEGPRAARPTLLGEFVCQLCKEPYADPLALAQHRCSRIVRVEYRCPECHKIFSCPANLASHRRWHKPRPSAAAAAAAGPAQDKENSSRDQHHGARDSSCCRDPPAALPARLGQGGPGELFLCPYCHKTFRRQAYLRKHLGTHQPPGYRASPPQPPLPSPQPLSFPCHLCGAHFPSADIRDKHRLWHAVREELLLPLGQPEGGGAAPGQQQIFSCKHCPATFFSSPGLTRHINKCHPSENRQVLLLQMPVRPGC